MSFSSSNQVQISKNTLVSIFNTIEPSISFSKTYNENDTVTVKVLENDYFHFDFMKDIESKTYEVENTFVLKKIDNTYKIISLRKVQDFYVMITNEYKTGKSNKDAKKELDKIRMNRK